MPVLDLRPGRRSSSPAVEVWDSPAAELLRIAAALARQEHGSFDVGDDRLRGLREDLPRETVEALGNEKSWLQLTRLVARLPAPGTVDDLLALLLADPTTSWRVLLASASEVAAEAVDQTLVDAYVESDGGAEAADALRAALGAGLDDPWAGDLLESLLETNPRTHGVTAHATLSALLDGPGRAMLAEAAGPMARDVAHRQQQLAEGRAVPEVVVDATNGYELTDDMPIDGILLMPSYWFRPWIIIARDGRTEVLTSPVSDEFLSLPSAAPPPSLVKLCKALGDDGRLRLLRRMSGSTITLADAMAELDVAKTTAHHHLSILRHAGLVAVRGEGRDTTYGLRRAAPDAAHQALRGYLGDAPAGVSETEPPARAEA